MPLPRAAARIVIEFTGQDVALLANEAGLHRIQHVPDNDRRGRTQTSSLTVAVLAPGAVSSAGHPAAQRAPSDFRVTWFSGTGPGGQNRNKVQASARIEHLPTGRVRTAQTRSRKASQEAAMAALLADLDALLGHAAQASLHAARRQQTHPEAARRRTWRFQEDRVVDAVTGRSASCRRVLRGGFRALWPDNTPAHGSLTNN